MPKPAPDFTSTDAALWAALTPPERDQVRAFMHFMRANQGDPAGREAVACVAELVGMFAERYPQWRVVA